MKFILITYGISWLILLIAFAVLKLRKSISREKREWYKDALLILFAPIFAPIIILIIPIFLIGELIENKKQKKLNMEWEKEKKEEEKKKLLAQQNYHSAINLNSTQYTQDYADIASALFSLAKSPQYDKLLSCLNELTLQSGWILNVDICKQRGIGDDSRLMVTKGDNTDFKIWDHIEVNDSSMAAWQIYLLHSLWHALPHFWHGGYNRRSYIFTSKDIPNIEFIRPEHRNKLMSIIYDKLENLTPEIIKYNDMYYVTCCYWSDWDGLIRELVEIKIANHKVESIFNVDKVILFKYHCGIWF